MHISICPNMENRAKSCKIAIYPTVANATAAIRRIAAARRLLHPLAGPGDRGDGSPLASPCPPLQHPLSPSSPPPSPPAAPVCPRARGPRCARGRGACPRWSRRSWSFSGMIVEVLRVGGHHHRPHPACPASSYARTYARRGVWWAHESKTRAGWASSARAPRRGAFRTWAFVWS